MVAVIVSITQILIALTDFLPRLIAFCAVLATIIPPTTEGFWGEVYKIINGLAFNFGHAKNIQQAQDND